MNMRFHWTDNLLELDYPSRGKIALIYCKVSKRGSLESNQNMKKAKKLSLSVSKINHSAIIMALGLSGGMAFAAGTAADTASNYSGGGWGTTPPNNGSGFGAWNMTVNNGNNPPYVGTYLDTGSSVVSGGYSWGTYANGSPGNGSLSITRPFTTGASTSSSLFNQTFSFDLSSGGVGPSQGDLSVQIGNAFLFQYLGAGSDNFTFNDPTSGLITTPVNFSALNAGLVVSLAVSGALNSSSEGYTFTVSPFAGGSPLYTTSGTFDSSAFNTSSFNYLDSNTTGNGYFNSLNITAEAVPEPTTLALVGLSGLATLVVRRRK